MLRCLTIKRRYKHMVTQSSLDILLPNSQKAHKDVLTKPERAVISSRFKQLQSQCEKLRNQGHTFGKPSTKTLTHIIVNDKQKTMYCYVPKIACTNLKRMFLFLTGRVNVTDLLNLSPKEVHVDIGTTHKILLVSYSEEEIRYRLNNYRKVIFVREPLVRLLSAFRNKFDNVANESNSKFHKRYGNKIIHADQHQQSNVRDDNEIGVTFHGFVQYLIQPKMSPSSFNGHWAPVSELCSPCDVMYDFIGKFESIDDDVQLLLKAMSVEDQVPSFPERNNPHERTEETVEQYYKTIESQQLKALLKIYELDYNLFGYPMPKDLSSFTKQTF